MPANLNALIRYKQIDRELSNPYLKTTIKSLQEACSNQLAEHRGIYKLISERTIRDDIRVMRSEALGFNAPIVVENGVYSYSNKDYSIFHSKIDSEELLMDILKLLLEEKENIKNPNIEDVITSLRRLISPAKKLRDSYAKKIIRSEEEISYASFSEANDEPAPKIYFNLELDSTSDENQTSLPSEYAVSAENNLSKENQKKKKRILNWKHILELLSNIKTVTSKKTKHIDKYEEKKLPQDNLELDNLPQSKTESGLDLDIQFILENMENPLPPELYTIYTINEEHDSLNKTYSWKQIFELI